MELRLEPLTSQHAVQLGSFRCAEYRKPWTEDVEELVRESLAFSLGAGDLVGIGLWQSTSLIAVIAWREFVDEPWYSALLAVATGHQRHGYGRQLKVELLNRAELSGAKAVYSLIDWDNDSALKLNQSLGASIERDPEARHQRLIATIYLT